MSNTVDNRVVELGFNNSKFEQGVSKSMGTLEKLNNALDRSNSSKGLINLSNSVKGFDASPMVTAVENIAQRFTSLGIIGVTALENITNRAVNAGIALTKSLSIDQVTAGWQKFADKTTSVGTIINNARKELTGEAYTIEEVGEQMERLNWFTDETSYNFVDMVNNIGKFTAQGKSLETANVAMQGIANWAAVSGQNASTASRAMYNMAQALGVGSVKLMDWKSIENANMATVEFKETVLETAVSLGSLKKAEDGVYETTKGTAVTMQSFDQSLADGWFNAEVLMATLEKYGSFGNKLAEVTTDLDVTATDFIKGITEFQNDPAGDGYLNWLEDLGLTASKVTPYMEELTSQEYELGLKAFKAAQEARTFRDAVDAIKDGVSTSWMNVFETIFGNYEESKKLWTSFANEGYEIFAEPINKLNNFLNNEKVKTGFQYIKSSFQDIKEFSKDIIAPVKEAFYDIFPNGFKISEDSVLNFGKKFKESIQDLKISEETIQNIKDTFKGFFSVISAGVRTVKNIAEALKPLGGPILNLGKSILNATGSLGRWILGLNEGEEKAGLFSSIVNGIASAISWFSDKINNFSLGDAFNSAIEFIKEKLSGLSDVFSNVKDKLGNIDLGKTILTIFKVGLLNAIRKWFNGLNNINKGFGKAISSIAGLFEPIGEVLSSWSKKIKVENLSKIALAILGIAVSLLLLSSIEVDDMMNALGGLFILFAELSLFMLSLTAIANGFKKFNVKAFNKISSSLVKIAVSLILLAAALKIMSTMDAGEIGKSLLTMLASLAILIGALFLLSKIKGPVVAGASAILIISAALVILAAALAAFSLVVKMGELGKGLLGMAVSLAEVGIALGLLAKFCSGGKLLAASVAILITSTALVALAGAIALLSILPTEKMWNSIAGLAVSLLLVGSALALLGLASPMILVGAAALLVANVALLAGAVAMLAMSVALNIFVPALKSMNDIGFGTIATGLLKLAGGFIVFSIVGAIAGVVSPLLALFAGALLLLGPALMVFAPAIQMLEGLELGKIAGGLAEIAGALGLFDAALAILSPFTPILLAFSGVIENVASVFANVNGSISMISSSSESLKDVGKAFRDFTKSSNMKQLGNDLTGFVETLQPFIAAFDNINMTSITKIKTISDGINSLNSIGDLSAESIDAFVSQLEMLVPELERITSIDVSNIDQITSAMSSLYTVFNSMGGTATEGLEDGLTSGLDTLPGNLSETLGNVDFSEMFSNINSDELTSQFQSTIGTSLEGIDLTSFGGIAADSFGEGFSMNSANVTESIQQLMGGVTETTNTEFNDIGSEASQSLLEGLTSIEDQTAQEGSNVAAKVTEAIKSELSKLPGIIRSSLNDAVFAIRGFYSSFYSSGSNIGQGAVNGLNSMHSSVHGAGYNLGLAAIQGFNLGSGVHSPSKKTYASGVFIGQGGINGLLSMISSVHDAGKDLGEASVDGFGEAIKRIGTILNTDISLNPTITPVLDLSNIQNGVNDVNSLFNDSKLSMNGTFEKARSAYIIDDTNDVGGAKTPQGGTVNNFVQNNYSPKALNRIDIYRQTKNLINSKA